MKPFVHSFIAKGLLFITLVLYFSCKKEIQEPVQKEDSAYTLLPSAANRLKVGGATQISGVGFFAATGECGLLIDGAAFALKMTGDLEGCLYVFIDDFECSPSGTYREKGREYFVGTYNGKTGTFWTTYKFEAKYEGCAANGAPLGAEIFGRCQHPIVKSSGTGVFEGVTGRLDFKDDIEAGNYPYRGHLQYWGSLEPFPASFTAAQDTAKAKPDTLPVTYGTTKVFRYTDNLQELKGMSTKGLKLASNVSSPASEVFTATFKNAQNI